MALTKVSGHIIDQPFDVGIITATNQYVSGIGTFGNIRVLGDLQVDGTTTTLDTVVTEVDRLEIGANNNTVAVAVTQSGSGDAAYFMGGDIGINTTTPRALVDFGPGTGNGTLNQTVANYQAVFEAPTGTGNYTRNIAFASRTSAISAAINAVDEGGSDATGLIIATGNAGAIAERVRVSAGGLVGIGTDNPDNHLHLLSTGGTVAKIESTNATSSLIRFANASGQNVYIGAKDTNEFFIRTGASERLRITSGGNVGIGTDNPTAPLTVMSSSDPEIKLGYKESQSHTITWDSSKLFINADPGNANGSSALGFRVDGTERLRISSGGYVGLGTDNPRSKLDIQGSDSELRFYRDAGDRFGGLRYTGSLFKLRLPAADHFVIDDASNNERLRVDSSGRIGINQTSINATRLLELTQPSGYDSAIRINTAASAGNPGYIEWFSGVSNYKIGVDHNSDNLRIKRDGTTLIRIDSAGNFNLESDSAKFTAGAGNDLQIYHNGGHSYIKNTTGQLSIRDDSEVNISDNSGNLMIRATASGASELYNNTAKKLETTSTGAKVTGALEVTQEYPSIRPTLDLNFAATKTLDRRITFTRDSLGTYVDDMGIIKYASNNVPRFDHDPTTGESLGLLIERSRTNDFAHSDPANAVWLSDGGVTKTANTTDTVAPDGSFTATKLASQASANSYSQIYDTLSKSSGGVQSLWAKKGTHNVLAIYDFSGGSGVRAWFDLNTGEHRCEGGSKVAAGVQSNGNDSNNTNMVEYPNGWYRCIYYEAANMDYSHIRIADFDSDTEASSSSNTIYLWGLQAEVNKTFATSFIPSLSGAMPATNSTRAADSAVIKGTNLTDWYNQSEGTFLVESSSQPAKAGKKFFNMDDNATGSGLYEMVEMATQQVDKVNIFSYDGQVTQSDIRVTPATTGRFKAAARLKTNDVQIAVDGTLGTADTSASQPSNLNRFIIGNYSSGDYTVDAPIARIAYYNKGLPDAQLQGLTQQ